MEVKIRKKGGILFGGSRVDRVLRSIEGRRSFPRTHERNAKILGGYSYEEIKIACRGNF